MKEKWFRKSWFSLLFVLCGTVAFYVILTHLPMVWTVVKTIFSYVAPVFIGMVIAYVLDPVANFFEQRLFGRLSRKKPVIARMGAVFLTVVAVVFLVVGFFVLLVVPIVRSIISLASNLENYFAAMNEMVAVLQQYEFMENIDLTDIMTSLSGLGAMIVTFVSENMQTVINTSVKVGSGVVMFVIEFIIAIYLLVDKRNLQQASKRLLRLLLRDRTYKAIASYVRRCNPIIYRFIGCDLLDGLIVGVANAIFMMIAGIPNVALISVIVGVCNLAPTFGPIVGGVVGALILFIVNPWYAVAFVIFTLILQMIDGYILKPKMFGNIMDVSAVWILICIIVLGRMFGILGVLLSIPFAAISAFTYGDYICPALQKWHDARAQREYADARKKKENEENKNS